MASSGARAVVHRDRKPANAPVDGHRHADGNAAVHAPDLASGASVAGPSADLFSFGVLAHELLLGQLPFATPPILDALAGRAVASLIRRCIDADSAVRPTAAEALAVLEAS